MVDSGKRTGREILLLAQKPHLLLAVLACTEAGPCWALLCPSPALASRSPPTPSWPSPSQACAAGDVQVTTKPPLVTLCTGRAHHLTEPETEISVSTRSNRRRCASRVTYPASSPPSSWARSSPSELRVPVGPLSPLAGPGTRGPTEPARSPSIPTCLNHASTPTLAPILRRPGHSMSPPFPPPAPPASAFTSPHPNGISNH